MGVAERDGLVALHPLVAAEANIVAALFGCRRRAIAVNDRGVEQAILMKLQHRGSKNGSYAAIGHPPPPSAVYARVMDLRTAAGILIDRQLLPLAPRYSCCRM